MANLKKLTEQLEQEIKKSIKTGNTDYKKISKLQTKINKVRDKKTDTAVKKQNFDLLYLPSGNNSAQLSFLLDKYEKSAETRSKKQKIKWAVGGILGSTFALIATKKLYDTKQERIQTEKEEFLLHIQAKFMEAALEKYKEHPQEKTKQALVEMFENSRFYCLCNEEFETVLQQEPGYWVYHLLNEANRTLEFKTN